MKKFMRKNVTWGGLAKFYGIAWLISIIIVIAEFAWVFKWPTKIKSKFLGNKCNKDDFE